MIGYINGKVVGQMGSQVIVRIPNGLGYIINVGSGEAYMQNEMFERFVLQVNKEDKVDLYGFKTLEERKWVEKFLKVNGVGPKMAANVVFTLGVEGILRGLGDKDPKVFGAVKGLGGKTAKKILLELKGDELQVDELEQHEVAVSIKSQTVTDFTETLASLGYKRGQVVNVIAQLKKDGLWDEKDLKSMVREGLKYFAK